MLTDAPRPGRRPALLPDAIAAVVETTLHMTPPRWGAQATGKLGGTASMPRSWLKTRAGEA